MKDNYDQGSILSVNNEYIALGNIQQCIKYFTYQHSKYIWQDDILQFTALKVPDEKLTLNCFLEDSHGLTQEEHKKV